MKYLQINDTITPCLKNYRTEYKTETKTWWLFVDYQYLTLCTLTKEEDPTQSEELLARMTEKIRQSLERIREHQEKFHSKDANLKCTREGESIPPHLIVV